MTKSRSLISAAAAGSILLAAGLTVTAFTTEQPARAHSSAAVAQAAKGGGISPVASKQEVMALTAEWQGERFADGRPKVPDDVVETLEKASLERVWEELEKLGYNNQFSGEWQTVHDDRRVVGRALTAQYLPSSPGLEQRMTEAGQAAGHEGSMNTWPINMLQNGDVYVADGFGKVKDGTLIGGGLGATVYEKSQNGVVFDAGVRDLTELEKIDGFNAYVSGFHPSDLEEEMLNGVNTQIRIKESVVLPGDIVIAEREGVLFVPAHLAAEVAEKSAE